MNDFSNILSWIELRGEHESGIGVTVLRFLSVRLFALQNPTAVLWAYLGIL